MEYIKNQDDGSADNDEFSIGRVKSRLAWAFKFASQERGMDYGSKVFLANGVNAAPNNKKQWLDEDVTTMP